MHSSSYNDPGVYAGEPAGLVMTFEDGKRVYHAGDTAVFGDMKIIGELYQPDLCLLPIGSRFTMDPREAAPRRRTSGRPAGSCPSTTRPSPPLTGTPEQFAEEVAARGLSPEITVMEPGDSISV